MEVRKPETLRHNPDLGEVDPRSYPLLCEVRLRSREIGSNARVHEANQLVRAVDRLITAHGESRARVHLTAKPGVDPKDAIEVRVQPLTVYEQEKIDKLMADSWFDIEHVGAAGAKTGLWEVLKSGA